MKKADLLSVAFSLQDTNKMKVAVEMHILYCMYWEEDMCVKQSLFASHYSAASVAQRTYEGIDFSTIVKYWIIEFPQNKNKQYE